MPNRRKSIIRGRDGLIECFVNVSSEPNDPNWQEKYNAMIVRMKQRLEEGKKVD